MNPPSLAMVERAIGAELLRARYAYSEREAILYALGIGAPANWLAADELKFVHEMQPDFQVLPTFGVIFARELHDLVLSGNVAGITYNPMMLVTWRAAADTRAEIAAGSGCRIGDISRGNP